MSRDADYYGLLGVAKDASAVEIRERFRALARERHPDRAPAGKKAEAEAEFQMLTEAVNVLTNPERRAAYAQMLYRAGRRIRDRGGYAHSAMLGDKHAVCPDSLSRAQQRAEVLRVLQAVEGQ